MPGGCIQKDLSAFVCGLQPEAIPSKVIDRARVCFVDWLGVTLQGAQATEGRILAKTLNDGRRKGPASFIGTGLRGGIFDAALFNGTAGHALDYDDVHAGMEGHPSAVVFPAAIGLCEVNRLPARELFSAFVAGVEVACRLGSMMNPDHYARGWHATGTLGVFGAAAAAGRLLHLSAEQMTSAFGMAATQASGIRRVFGTMAKPLNAGRAAANGLLAAVLAGSGFTGPTDVFEGRMGLLPLLGARELSGQAWRPKERWAVEEIVFKRFASCYSTHAAMEAALSLRDRCPSHRIRSVRLWVSPFSRQVASVTHPRNALEGKFSLPFCTAVALVRGCGGTAEFSPRTLQDRQVQRVMGLVEVHSRRSLGEFEAMLEIDLLDGRRWRRRSIVNEAPGKDWTSIVEEKFLEGVSPIVGHRRAHAILARVGELDGKAELRPVMALLLPVRTASGRPKALAEEGER